MAIVFGFDDDDLEPIDWLERIDLVDEALWAEDTLVKSVVFFDARLFRHDDVGASVEDRLNSLFDGAAVTLEQWGYLEPGEIKTRDAFSRLEHEMAASPLLRFCYGRGLLLAAVITVPPGNSALSRLVASQKGYVGLIRYADLDTEELLPTGC